MGIDLPIRTPPSFVREEPAFLGIEKIILWGKKKARHRGGLFVPRFREGNF